MSNKSNQLHFTDHLLSLLPYSFILIALFLALFYFPYEFLRPLLNSLASDGNFESFTRDKYFFFQPIAIFMQLVFLLAGSILTWKKEWNRKIIKTLISKNQEFKNNWSNDYQSFLNWIRNFSLDKFDARVLLGFIFLATIIRMLYLWQPMKHDEAYTITTFALASFRDIISDYQLPNNHIFHTLLVFLSYHLFGIHPWAVRLPAFLAGIFTVPAAYLFGRGLYNRSSALLGACLVAIFPCMVSYSTNARGYSQLALITMLIFCLGLYVKKHFNRFAWSGIILLSALGFYTIPVMAFPFGIVMTWLFLSCLSGDISQEYRNRLTFFKYIMLAVLSTGVLCLFLYLPVIFRSGIGVLTGNEFVQPVTWQDYRIIFGSRMQDTWHEWTDGISLPLVWLSVFGFLLSIPFHWRASKTKIPFQLAAILWIAVLILFIRPHPWPKVWYFLTPLLCIWSAAGLTSILQLIPFKWKNVFIRQILLIFLTIALLAGCFWRNFTLAPEYLRPGSLESGLLNLQKIIQPGDLLVFGDDIDAPGWYYMRLHTIDLEYLDRTHAFTKAFVVVESVYDQTLLSSLQKHGPDLALFNLEAARVVFQDGLLTIYELIPDPVKLKEIYTGSG